jgi:hypothetical protein
MNPAAVLSKGANLGARHVGRPRALIEAGIRSDMIVPIDGLSDSAVCRCHQSPDGDGPAAFFGVGGRCRHGERCDSGRSRHLIGRSYVSACQWIQSPDDSVEPDELLTHRHDR